MGAGQFHNADGSVKQDQVSAVGNGFLFTGRRLDPELSNLSVNHALYYYRARYYDTNLGRFIGRDPIGYESEDMNLYRYVASDPLDSLDPSGLRLFGRWPRRRPPRAPQPAPAPAPKDVVESCVPSFGGAASPPVVSATCDKECKLDLKWTPATISTITDSVTYTVVKPNGEKVRVKCDRTKKDIQDSRNHEQSHVDNCHAKLKSLEGTYEKAYGSMKECNDAITDLNDAWTRWLDNEGMHTNPESPAVTFSCNSEYNNSKAAGLCGKETPVK